MDGLVARGSSITVGDLLATRSLQLGLIAGGTGLARAVEWTHVSEIEDPAPWLDGGELLMTNGLGLPADGAAQAEFVASLDRRRAVALAIGVRGPELQPEMLATAEKLSFPLLHIPREVPFLSIARMVADANHSSSHQRLLTHVRIFDTLRPGDQVPNPEETFQRLEEISGYTLYLISATGTPLFSGFRRPPADVVQGLGSGFTPNSGTPSVPGGHAVRVPLAQRQGTFLVAIERDGASPAGLGAVRHMATIAALELSKLYLEREAQRRQGAETLARLFAGRLDSSDADVALAEAGFDPGAPLILAAVRGTEGDPFDDEVHHRVCDIGVPHMLMSDDGDLFVVLPAAPDVLDRVVSGLPLRVGVSEERIGLHGWSVARKEAIWALAQASGPACEAGGVHRFTSAQSSVHWLPTDIGSLEELANQILGPIVDYDADHNGSLLQSLRVYFKEERRLQAAAVKLHVHKHTLSYRLSRIEQITGRDMSSMADLVPLWLALQAYEIVGRPARRQQAPRPPRNGRANGAV